MPEAPEPADSALTLTTAVLMWRKPSPIAPPACRRRLVALTFFVLPVAFVIEPLAALTETLLALTLPKATPVAASRRAEEPATTLLAPSIRIAPLVATRLTVPAVLTVAAAPPWPTSI